MQPEWETYLSPDFGHAFVRADTEEEAKEQLIDIIKAHIDSSCVEAHLIEEQS